MVFDDNNGIVSYNRVISWNKRGKISDRIVMDQKRLQMNTKRMLSQFQVVQIYECPRSSVITGNNCLSFTSNNANATQNQSQFFETTTRCNCCPKARSGHRIFSDRNFVYLVGGYNQLDSPDKTYTDVWRFNQLTNQWKLCSVVQGSVPATLASFSLVSITDEYSQTEALIYGGTGVPFGTTASNELHRLRINPYNGLANVQPQRHQRAVSENQATMPRIYGHASCGARVRDANNPRLVKEKVYLIGGTTGHVYNMDVWELESPAFSPKQPPSNGLDWTCQKLTTGSNELEGRYRMEAVLHEDKLLTFGGGAPDLITEFRELLAFDLRLKQWTKVSALPDPQHGFPLGRKCHAIVEWKDGVYMIGGSRDRGQANEHQGIHEIFSDVWRFDLISRQWQRLSARLPIPVFFHSATISEVGCLYVFGGCASDDSTSRTNRLQRIWLAPPPLQLVAAHTLLEHPIFAVNKRRIMAMVAIESYQPTLSSVSPSKRPALELLKSDTERLIEMTLPLMLQGLSLAG